MRVCTDAGIFGELAIRAIRQVQSEFFDNRFGLRSGFDLDDSGKLLPSGTVCSETSVSPVLANNILTGAERIPVVTVTT